MKYSNNKQSILCIDKCSQATILEQKESTVKIKNSANKRIDSFQTSYASSDFA